MMFEQLELLVFEQKQRIFSVFKSLPDTVFHFWEIAKLVLGRILLSFSIV